MLNRKWITVVVLTTLVFMITVIGSSADDDNMGTFRVTIKNVAQGQPISPPVVATHRDSVTMFEVGQSASAELEAIAEDGNQGPLAAALGANDKVTDVVDAGRPLTLSGATVGDFTDTVTLEIQGRNSDVLSVVGMLICTNDGFAGLSSVELPRRGARVHALRAYDAGTERNTQASADLVDPCSLLGPAPLNGDANGNNNDSVASGSQVVEQHPRIRHDRGDLSAAHDWPGRETPIAFIIIERIN